MNAEKCDKFSNFKMLFQLHALVLANKKDECNAQSMNTSTSHCTSRDIPTIILSPKIRVKTCRSKGSYRSHIGSAKQYIWFLATPWGCSISTKIQITTFVLPKKIIIISRIRLQQHSSARRAKSD